MPSKDRLEILESLQSDLSMHSIEVYLILYVVDFPNEFRHWLISQGRGTGSAGVRLQVCQTCH